MKEEIEYILEYKPIGDSRYLPRYSGFKSKTMALDQAEESCLRTGMSIRIIEQKRKVIKVFGGRHDSKSTDKLKYAWR